MKSKNGSNGFITIRRFIAVRKLSTKFSVPELSNPLTDVLHKFVGTQLILQKYVGIITVKHLIALILLPLILSLSILKLI
jgi:hypothetical protein